MKFRPLVIMYMRISGEGSRGSTEFLCHNEMRTRMLDVWTSMSVMTHDVEKKIGGTEYEIDWIDRRHGQKSCIVVT